MRMWPYLATAPPLGTLISAGRAFYLHFNLSKRLEAKLEGSKALRSLLGHSGGLSGEPPGVVLTLRVVRFAVEASKHARTHVK